LLGACTYCPGLHEKIVELRSRIVSLEADLKVPIPTSFSTCELHAMKNLELAQCVDHLQDENNKLHEVLSWLSSQEPQLGMMIASCKRFDGWALGFDKVVLTVNSCIKVRLDLQADKFTVVVKGPFFPRVVNPRYRIRGTNV
jgi:hypothetical protein